MRYAPVVLAASLLAGCAGSQQATYSAPYPPAPRARAYEFRENYAAREAQCRVDNALITRATPERAAAYCGCVTETGFMFLGAPEMDAFDRAGAGQPTAADAEVIDRANKRLAPLIAKRCA